MDLEKLATECVNDCDSTVTMDSDQRRACKQYIFLALQQAWFAPVPVKENAELRAQLAAVEKERDEARRAIDSFGSNPNGFDWAFLAKMEELEAENAALREACEGAKARAKDDAILVDYEFAKSVMTESDSNMRYEKSLRLNNDDQVWLYARATSGPKCWDWTLYCHGLNRVCNDPTRGDVRRLLEGLKLTNVLQSRGDV